MSNKTYAEHKGFAPFDWNKFLDNPPESGSKESWDAATQAGKWVTCACGNLCKDIPRYDGTEGLRDDGISHSVGEPKDRRLASLGAHFFDAIDEEDWHRAKKVLVEIEKRSSEILKRL